MKIALAGNPNCGKTTLFNALTGSSQYVGNWPGVTVEKKDGLLAGHKDVVIQDLPGSYSLSPYTLEEVVARNYLVNEKPDAILNIVDGSNLERNLFLTTQLLELGLPIVVAVNMIDVVRRNGDRLDAAKLAKKLGCPVIEISARGGENTLAAAELAIQAAADGVKGESPHVFSGSVEHALAHIEESLHGTVENATSRWAAIKVFERDAKAIETLQVPADIVAHVEEHISDCEREMEDDAESIITTQRYGYVQRIMAATFTRSPRRASTLLSDRIDRVVTHRVFALPIFALTLCAMWWLAVAEGGPGACLTDWVNEGLLGNGSWRIPFTSWQVPGVGALIGRAMEAMGAGEAARGLVVDGAWGGVATVLGFVPVICIVFMFLAFLEDCGYMARVAFIMDRYFRGFGLSGKSFIPMVVGKGCGVPAVMAARTIENARDRRMTIILATFIPCSAKTVIIVLFSAAFFREMWYVAPLMDLVGVAIVVLGGLALKKTRLFAGDAAPFVMELPAYHMPTLSGILLRTWTRVRGFVVKAGLVIFPACVLLWVVMNFDFRFNLVGAEGIGRSMLATMGGWIAWLFAPLGFGTWQGAAASISAEVAKEQAVATLGLMSANMDGASAPAQIANLFASFSPFPRLAAMSFMLFNLFMPPCLGAVAVTFREMGSKAWGCFAVAFQLFVGYVLALSVYQFGVLFAGGGFGVWTAVAVLADAGCLWSVFRAGKKTAA